MEPRLQRRVQRYGWDKAAEYYDKSWKDQLKPSQDKLLEMADPKPGEKVIETSCGTGLVTFRIAKKIGANGHILATDLSDTMIDMANSIASDMDFENITFQRMDAEELKVSENKFDLGICSLGLMYFPFPDKALKELFRALKPEGRVAVSVWGERKNCGWAEIFPIVDKHVASDVCPMFFQQGTGNTLRFNMEKAGFTDIESERFPATIHYPNDDEALTAAFAGGPVALAYQKFDDTTRNIVHKDYLTSIQLYKTDNGYDIPGEFVVMKGVKK